MSKSYMTVAILLLSTILNIGGCTMGSGLSTTTGTTQISGPGGDTTGAATTEPVEIIDGKTLYPNLIYQNENTAFLISPDNLPNDGELFADLKNYPTGQRSGHVGHAMVEYADGKILAFYSSCNLDNKGHSARGWMEYKRSEDGGITWSEPYKLPYSYDTYFGSNGERSVMSEKAIVTDDGTIIVFNLEINVKEHAIIGGYLEPTYITSRDGGYTWSEAKTLDSAMRGRVFDTMCKDGTVYVLAKDFGIRRYAMYISENNGESFKLYSYLTLDGAACTYGALSVLKDGRLIAYAYRTSEEDTEYDLPYCISENNGRTWSKVQTAHFAKRLRNPQMARLGNTYFIFGRSGNDGAQAHNFVMYCSQDGINWDEGTFVSMKGTGAGAYSNTLVVGKFNNDKPDRLLVMASRAYLLNRAEVVSWWIDIKELT